MPSLLASSVGSSSSDSTTSGGTGVVALLPRRNKLLNDALRKPNGDDGVWTLGVGDLSGEPSAEPPPPAPPKVAGALGQATALGARPGCRGCTDGDVGVATLGVGDRIGELSAEPDAALPPPPPPPPPKFVGALGQATGLAMRCRLIIGDICVS